MSCPNCDMQNHAEAPFCQRCGVQLSGLNSGSAAAKKSNTSLHQMLTSKSATHGQNGYIPMYDRKVLLIGSAVIAGYFIIVLAVNLLG